MTPSHLTPRTGRGDIKENVSQLQGKGGEE